MKAPVDPHARSLDGKVLVSIREFLERIVDERDRLYDIRFKAAETAVYAALAAQEKQTASAFLASEKAIVKAEDAQREYNVRSNEFRGQLDDQAKMLMPRAEVSALLKAVDEKISSTKVELAVRLDGIMSSVDKNHAATMTDISGLRESRVQIQGLFVTREQLESRAAINSGRIEALEKIASRWLGVVLAISMIAGLAGAMVWKLIG